jgi:hypothetical protein
MTEEPKKEFQLGEWKIDVMKIMPTIAKLYSQFHWIIGLTGYNVPPEVHKALITLAKGENMTPEEMQTLQKEVEGMTQTIQPQIGEPVLTEDLAKDAWEMHYKEGKSFRQIAEILTKEGYPCSHATIARYVEMVNMAMKANKMIKLFRIARIASYIVPPIVAFWIGITFF